jgi:hypothetical protein
MSNFPSLFVEVASRDGASFSTSSKGDICFKTSQSNQQMHFGVTGNSNPTFSIDTSNFLIFGQLGVGSGSNPLNSVFEVKKGNAFFESNVYIMNRLGIGTTTPSESLDVSIGNIKGASNMYVVGSASFGSTSSNPSETLDVGSNLKVRSNIYVLNAVSIGSSNPTEKLQVVGNAKVSNNLYALNAVGIGNSNPIESLDVQYNAVVRQNTNVYGRLGVATSNSPTENLEVFGNTKIIGNIYNLQNISIGSSNPTENLDVSLNAKIRSNVYALNSVCIGGSNPFQSLDVRGNIRCTTNAFIHSNVIVGANNSNPTERLDVIGNTKISSNLFVLNRIAVANSNPTERIDVTGNILSSSNIYALNNIGIGSVFPSERIDAQGNIKAASNVYALNALSVGSSNPEEKLYVDGNEKVTQNIYVIGGSISVGHSNPTEKVDVIGNVKVSGNIFANNNLVLGSISVPTEQLDTQCNLKVRSNAYIMNSLGVATSNPTETVDVVGNAKIRSNIYILSNLGVANSNPTERVDVTGNVKVSNNIYTLNRLGVADSNPTETLDVVGNAKVRSNIYILSNLGVANSNPTERVDVTGNVKVSNNIYTLNRLGVADSNPTETLDIVGNAKVRSNIYILSNLGVANSNPTERVDITGNIKVSSNLYTLNRVGIANSNPTETLDVIGNVKVSSNMYTTQRHGVALSNPSESIDVAGNVKVRSNLYILSNLSIGNSNPTFTAHISGSLFASGYCNLLIDSFNSTSTSNAPTTNALKQVADLAVSTSNTLYVASGGGGGILSVAIYSSNTASDASNVAYTTSNTTFTSLSNTSNSINIRVNGFSNTIFQSLSNTSNTIFTNLATTNTNLTNTSNNIFQSLSNTSNNIFIISSNTSNVAVWASNNLVRKSGDTMTGGLIITGPTPSLTTNGTVLLRNGNYSNVFTSNQILFSWSNTNSFPHTVSTRHNSNANDTNNAIDFYVWQTSQTSNAAGNKHVVSITSTGTGIGTTNPSQSLHVVGKVYSDTQIINTSNDSSNVPAFSWAENSNTGMYRHAINTIGFTTGGTAKAVIDSLGNVAIGGNNPQSRLDVTTCSNIHPPAAMTSTTQVFGSASYTISSSFTTGGATLNVFDKNIATIWEPTNGGYSIGGAWSGSLAINTTIDGTVYGGHWIQIQLPSAIIVTELGIFPKTGSIFSPATTYLAGSSDGTTWTMVNSWADIGLVQSQYNYYTINPNLTPYSYYRLVFNSTKGSGNVAVNEVVFNSIASSIVTSGNVGVGLSTPIERLHVNGKVYASNQVLSSASNDSSNVPSFSWREDSNTGIYHPTTSTLGFSTAGVPRMVINSSGNVGVGVDTPIESLHVNGKVYASNQVLSSASNDSSNVPSFSWREDSNTGIYHPTTSTLGFSTAGVPRMFINSTGNVGIGLSNPSQRLHVSGNETVTGTVSAGDGGLGYGNAGTFNAFVGMNSTFGAGSNIAIQLGRATVYNDSWFLIHTHLSNTSPSNYFQIAAYGSGNSGLAVQAGGNVGIGTTSPVHKLHVVGKVYSDTQLLVSSNDSATTPGYSYLGNSNTGMFHSALDTLGFSTNGTSRMIIDGSGNIGIGTASLSQRLHVSGNEFVTGIVSAGDGGLGFGNPGTFNAFVGMNSTFGSGSNVAIQLGRVTALNESWFLLHAHLSNTSPSNYFQISAYASGNTGLVVQAGGNVGIGTTSPVHRLHVAGDINFTGTLRQNGSVFTSGTTSHWSNNSSNVYVNTGSNVGIAISTPSFPLHVVGKIYTDTQLLVSSNDSATTPGYSYLGNSNTGMFHPANDSLGFSTSGTSRMVIDGSGNIGIGTASPALQLHLSQPTLSTAVQFRLSASNNTLNSDIGVASAATQFFNSTLAGDLVIRNTTGSNIHLGSGTTTPTMTLNSNANVGIGTAAPTVKVAITGTDNSMQGPHINFTTSTDTYPLLQFLPLAHNSVNIGMDVAFNGTNWISSTAGGNFLMNKVSHLMQFLTASNVTSNASVTWTNALSITSGANIGIGTVTPAYKLDVNGGIQATNCKLGVQGSVDGTSARGLFLWDTSDNGWGIYVATSNASRSLANGTSCGFGTVSQHAVRFRAFNSSSMGFIFENTSEQCLAGIRASDGRMFVRGDLGIGTESPSEKLHVIGKILASDDITAFSDKRLKSNITPITDGLSKVLRLNGYTFNKTCGDAKKYTGLIAQEVKEVLPEVVHQHEDGIYSIAYGNMAGLFVEAIKTFHEQYQSKINELETKIHTLYEIIQQTTKINTLSQSIR